MIMKQQLRLSAGVICVGIKLELQFDLG